MPDLTPVLADTTQVEQILVNLVSTRATRCRWRQDPDRVAKRRAGQIGGQRTRFQPVTMSRCRSPLRHGMDSDTLSIIFEPFFTTKESGKGTGRIGDRVRFGSRTTAPSRCRAVSGTAQRSTYLPRATDLGKRHRCCRASRPDERFLPRRRRPRARARVEHAEKNGFTVLLASAGDQALEIAARHRGRIHILLTDVLMPGLNGRMLSERLTTSRPETRVLYMSGYANDDIMRLGVKKAAAHFIQKPFSVDALVHKIRDTLNSPGNVPTRS